MTQADIRVLVTIGLLVLYGLVMPTVGFFVTSAIFLFVHMLYLGIRGPVWLLAPIVVLLGTAWALFENFLGVPLPHGLIY